MEVHLLMSILLENVKWNRARVYFIASFIIALIKVRTVNFTEIAVALKGETKKKSKYTRIVRFFRNYKVNYKEIAEILAALIPEKNSLWLLTIDRTNWKIGRVNINVLMIGIAHKGIAFPIYWTLLEKRGNSNTDERKWILECFLEIFPVAKIHCLVADREFIGKKWFTFLLDKFILFRIRIKGNMLVTNSRGIEVHAKTLFRHLPIGKFLILDGQRNVCGHRLYVIGLRTAEEFVILVTNDLPHSALDDYKERWQIETLFAAFKTRGFSFEDTHLTDPERIRKLVAMLALAFTFSHIVGEWLHQKDPIKIKIHGRREISFFRYGLDHLRFLLLNFEKKNIFHFKKALSLFRSALQNFKSLHLDTIQ